MLSSYRFTRGLNWFVDGKIRDDEYRGVTTNGKLSNSNKSPYYVVYKRHKLEKYLNYCNFCVKLVLIKININEV